jgi:hypothetical protein
VLASGNTDVASMLVAPKLINIDVKVVLLGQHRCDIEVDQELQFQQQCRSDVADDC